MEAKLELCTAGLDMMCGHNFKNAQLCLTKSILKLRQNCVPVIESGSEKATLPLVLNLSFLYNVTVISYGKQSRTERKQWNGKRFVYSAR